MRTVGTALILMLVLSTIPPASFSQSGFKVSAGAGLPDLVNVGVHYSLSKVEVGAAVGTVPFLSGETFLSGSAQVKAHLHAGEEASGASAWFLKSSTSYWESRAGATTRSVHQSVKLGHDFTVSESTGLALSAGPMVQLYESEVASRDPVTGLTSVSSPRGPVVPLVLGVRVFYRL